MKNYSKTIGDKGEAAAVEFLKGKNYDILATKYKFRNGELDIVAKDKNVIVFAEVKTVDLTYTDKSKYGDPETWLTPAKQKFMRQCANHYLWKNEVVDVDCRFDLLAVRLYPERTDVNHIENAFWM